MTLDLQFKYGTLILSVLIFLEHDWVLLIASCSKALYAWSFYHFCKLLLVDVVEVVLD